MKRNPTRGGTITHLAGTKAKAKETEKGKGKATAGEEFASPADNQVTLPGNALRTTQGDAKGADVYGAHKLEGAQCT